MCVFLAVCFYVLIASAVSGVYYRVGEVAHQKRGNGYSNYPDTPAFIAAGVFWPVALPAFGFYALAKRLEYPAGEKPRE